MARDSSVRTIARLALLTAVAIALGWAEQFIPTPMPGIKLGLSNTVLLYALYLLNVKSAIALMLLKVLLSGFAYAGPYAMMYSLAGGALSLAMMILVGLWQHMFLGDWPFQNLGQPMRAALRKFAIGSISSSGRKPSPCRLNTTPSTKGRARIVLTG